MSRGCVCARQGDTRGLTHEQVRAMFKSTLSGLFRHLSGAFRGQEQYTRPQVLNTLRGGLEVAFSTLMENLEEMTGVEGTATVEREEERANRKKMRMKKTRSLRRLRSAVRRIVQRHWMPPFCSRTLSPESRPALGRLSEGPAIWLIIAQV
ncbi:hypothetical protein GWK47_039089 [Chionoecetes opilio]|uniref:Uncharacterized protein n=1 Tax=Chionoecetes opilio TaxID=41210 RepID=A0A8J4YBW3_CHIOP|nr:hypothetical protein GWK47_039089 [Chionoecetes opilio]